MAYEIVDRLEAKGLSKVLLRLKEGLSERDVAKGQKHRVFEDSFDAKPIYHRKFLLQKLQYIPVRPGHPGGHLNPVRGKWKLMGHCEDDEHSSARFYVKNKKDGFIPVHYEELG